MRNEHTRNQPVPPSEPHTRFHVPHMHAFGFVLYCVDSASPRDRGRRSVAPQNSCTYRRETRRDCVTYQRGTSPTRMIWLCACTAHAHRMNERSSDVNVSVLILLADYDRQAPRLREAQRLRHVQSLAALWRRRCHTPTRIAAGLGIAVRAMTSLLDGTNAYARQLNVLAALAASTAARPRQRSNSSTEGATARRCGLCSGPLSAFQQTPLQRNPGYVRMWEESDGKSLITWYMKSSTIIYENRS